MSGADVSLFSDRGWSIYLLTFVQPNFNSISKAQDPIFVEPGLVAISRGVPCRNEVRKHSIIDGPDKGILDEFEWQVEEDADEEATLRCASLVTYGRPYYGERHDSFVVSLRLIHEHFGNEYTRRSGYLEFFKAAWQVRHIKACPDNPHTKVKLRLQPGYATLSSFGDRYDPQDERSQGGMSRVLICLTANNTAARWRALISILNTRREGLGNRRLVLLRGNDCCFQYAIDEIIGSLSKWFIVL